MPIGVLLFALFSILVISAYCWFYKPENDFLSRPDNLWKGSMGYPPKHHACGDTKGRP